MSKECRLASRPIIVGVAGGTGSGKTTVVRAIVASLGGESVALLHHDAYYKDQSHLSPAEREQVNYDHPDALENQLLAEHLSRLLDGQPVDCPAYDFVTHTRRAETVRVAPRPVILLEGILILVDAQLRRLLDIKLFVDTDADIRFIRRLRRDLTERGRTLDSVVEQYLESVRPMHLEFVEPSKRYADLIIPEGGFNQVAVDVIVARIRAALDRVD